MDSASFIGVIDLGGTKILSLCLDGELNIVGRDRRETVASEGGPAAVIARMAASLRTAAAGRNLAAICVSTPGPCDPQRGIVSAAPNLPGWQDVPLAALISAELGVQAWIEHDATAAAWAEQQIGAGRGARNLLYVTVSTGIGGGLIIDGQPYRGVSGSAGEIGHMQLVEDGPLCGCGNRGCLEALASGRHLAEQAAAIVAAEPDGVLARLCREAHSRGDARLLSRAADAGDSSADAAIRRAGGFLGAGLGGLINILNPEIVVIGGSLIHLGSRYLETARAAADARAFTQAWRDVRIVEASLGDDSPAIGAALIAMQKLHWTPHSG